MKKNLSYILLLGALLTCCNQINNNNKGGIYIPSNIDKFCINDTILLNEWIDSITYIPLETNDEYLISNITQAFCYEGKWVIFDYLGQAIYLFDNNGSFIKKVGNRGRGPEEYVKTNNIIVNNSTGEILVYCNATDRMIYYNKNGDFSKSVKFNRNSTAPIRNIGIINEKEFIGYSPDFNEEEGKIDGSGIWLLDSTGKFIKSYKIQNPIYPTILSLTSPYITTIGKNNDKVYIRDAVFSHLYSIDSTRLDSTILYNFHESEYRSYFNRKEFNGDVQHEWYIPRAVYSIVGGKWVFNYWKDQTLKEFVTIYDTKSKEIRFTKQWTDSGDKNIQLIPNSLPIVSNLTNAMVFVASFQSPTLTEYRNDIHNDSELRKLINTKKEDDNPILQIVYTKK